MGDLGFRITIPSDEDGYILLRCPHCGELFKVSTEEAEDDSVLNTYCPACGLMADSFLTDGVIALALAMAKNRAISAIAKELEKQLKGLGGSLIKFDVKVQDDPEPELPLAASIEALEVGRCRDCGSSFKVKQALSMSTFTCPYCGIGQFNDR